MTLMEIMFAVSMFSMFGVATVLAITNFNRLASLNRYHTLALAAAQQKIDQAMAAPWSVTGTRPAILTLSPNVPPQVGDPNYETGLPLNNDVYNSSRTGCKSPYSGLDTQVLDSRITTVTALTDASGKTGAASRLVQISVTVNYTYCQRFTTSVTLTTLRTTDDF